MANTNPNKQDFSTLNLIADFSALSSRALNYIKLNSLSPTPIIITSTNAGAAILRLVPLLGQIVFFEIKNDLGFNTFHVDHESMRFIHENKIKLHVDSGIEGGESPLNATSLIISTENLPTFIKTRRVRHAIAPPVGSHLLFIDASV